MSRSTAICNLLRSWFTPRPPRTVRRRPRSTLPRLECLEARAVPATFTVTNINDSGPGSLRAAVALANDEVHNPGADTIVFDPSLKNQTIALIGGENGPVTTKLLTPTFGLGIYGRVAIAITSKVTIDGEAAPGLQLSGTGARRLFVVAGPNAQIPVTGASLTLNNLTITGGRAEGGVSGGAGLGGAIFVDGGYLETNGVTFSQNVAVGGNGLTFTSGGGLSYNGTGGFASGGGFGGGARGGSNGSNPGSGGNGGFGGGGGFGGTGYAGFDAGPGGRGGDGGFGGGGGNGGTGGNSSYYGSPAIGGRGGNGGFGGGGGAGGAGGRGGDGASGNEGGNGGFGGGNGTTGFGGGKLSDGLSGGGAGMGGAIFNYNGTVKLLNSTTFTSNKAQGGVGGNNGQGLGGAVFNLGGTMTITGCTFTSNVADASGGAVYNAPAVNGVNVPHGTMTVTSCTFTSNTAAAGAAAYNGGTMFSPDSTLANNEASDQGGAYYNAAGADLTIANDQILNDTAGKDGGGIANFGTLTISGATVNGNSATEHDGGGIANFGSGTITNSTFTRNNAGLDGGGIANGPGDTLNAIDCTLNQNHADHDGGAIYDRGTEHIDPTTMTGNSAGHAGGGFFEVGGQNETSTNDFTEVGDQVIDSTFTVLGAGSGSSPLVQLRDNVSHQITLSFLAYDATFKGGVHVAQGWVADADGMPTEAIITVPASGSTALVRIFDAFTGNQLREFLAFPASIKSGASLAVGDATGDGVDDIIVGSRNTVRVFDGQTGAQVRQFLPYGAGFTGGVNVAVGDTNGDGVADIVTAPGAGKAIQVKAFDGVTGGLLTSFVPFGAQYTGAVSVAAGDINGNGYADIITGTGAGSTVQVKVYDGIEGAFVARVPVFSAAFKGGVSLLVRDVSGDGKADILVAAGPGGQSEVQVYQGPDRTLLDDYFADPLKKGYVLVS